jgi:MoaA/NifB/PqqE/SkfB family radical SAM enzyme
MVEITTRCNRNCPICEVNPNRAFHSDINADLVLEILRVLDEEGIETLSITGGEPTLPWDLLLRILKYAKGLGLETRIYTNGSTLSEEKITTLSQYLNSIVVSLDSLDREVVRKMRGTSDDLSTVIENIRLLSESPMETIIISVCSKVTKNSLLELSSFLLEIDIDGWWIQQFIPEGRGKDNLDDHRIDECSFLQTIAALEEIMPGKVRYFPVSGRDRKRVFVNYEGMFVDYQTSKILGPVLDDKIRHKIMNSKEYHNTKR